MWKPSVVSLLVASGPGCSVANDHSSDLPTLAATESSDSGATDAGVEGSDDHGDDTQGNGSGEPMETTATTTDPSDDGSSDGDPPPMEDCRFDARTQYVHPQHGRIESIVAYGALWEFRSDAGATPAPDNGIDLTLVTHMSAGPCAGQAPFACELDTRVMHVIDGVLVESITAYGKYWNFDVDLATGARSTWPSNGSSLDAVDRYASGPCQAQPAGACVFDTRELIETADGRVESITANGRYWNFGIDAWEENDGSMLVDVDRYAAGPCTVARDCLFDTRTMILVPDGAADVAVESIVAGGRYYNYDVADGSSPWASNGSLLSSVPRYAAGPCADAG